MRVSDRRWFNPSQPQTLQISVWLLYFNGVLGLLLGSPYYFLGPVLGLAALAGCVVGAFGIANEKKWGYALGVAVAALRLLIIFAGAGGITRIFSSGLAIDFLFAVALLAALLHPMSRDYQRIWFR